MPTPTSSNRLEKQDLGSNNNSWGAPHLNTGYDLVDAVADGSSTILLSAGNYALSAHDYAPDEARARILVLEGALTANAAIVAPAVPKWYWIRNQCTGPYAVGLTAGSNTITLPPGTSAAMVNGSGQVSFLIQSALALDTPVDLAVNTALTTGNLGNSLLFNAPLQATLPLAGAAGRGWYLNAKQMSAGASTIVVQGSDLVDGSYHTVTLNQLDSCRIECTGAGWAVLFPTNGVSRS